jgi:hypothetical protein
VTVIPTAVFALFIASDGVEKALAKLAIEGI